MNTAHHLSLQDLANPEHSQEQLDHLRACAQCRLEARMIQDMWQADPAESEDLEQARLQMNETRLHIQQAFSMADPMQTLDMISPDNSPSLPEELSCIAPLGQGGMGEVWRVKDPNLERTVAAKWLRTERLTQGTTAQRFIQEAKLTAQLQHPGIVPVYQVGHFRDGRPYFTMQEVGGLTLWQLIQQHHNPVNTPKDSGSGLSLRRLIDIFHRACQTVAYAHSRHILHRDLKPANIMVGEFGEVFVLDWGLAKQLKYKGSSSIIKESLSTDNQEGAEQQAYPHTQLGSLMGTLAYMPPEQAQGDQQALEFSSDVYALGATLYELLFGRSFRSGSTHKALLELACTGQRPNSQDHKVLPQTLIDIYLKATEQRPAQRYATARQLSEALEAWLDGDKRRQAALECIKQAVQSQEQLAIKQAKLSELLKQRSNLNIDAGAPISQKRSLWQLEGQIDDLRLQVASLETAYTQRLHSALNQDETLVEAHRLLADLYQNNHKKLEQAGKHLEAKQAESWLRQHATSVEHAAYLDGKGTLSLRISASDFSLRLYKQEQRDNRWQKGPLVGHFTYNLENLPLEMGSYLLEIVQEGCPTVKYPIFISRLGHWQGNFNDHDSLFIPPHSTYTSNDIYVPGSWFTSGTEHPGLNVWPRRKVWVPSFFMQTHPVSNGDYCLFLNDLLKKGQKEKALQHIPRERSASPNHPGLPLYKMNKGGLLELPTDADGDSWKADWPVMMVTWFDAMAYAQWLSEKSGLSWRLPHEIEWEKAARGANGRLYPWGNHFDCNYCIMNQNPQGRRTPAPLGQCTYDQSPYGIMGMAGNVGDWCLNIYETPPPAEGPLIIEASPSPSHVNRAKRGGSWQHDSSLTRCTERHGLLASYRSSLLGFRLMRTCSKLTTQ